MFGRKRREQEAVANAIVYRGRVSTDWAENRDRYGEDNASLIAVGQLIGFGFKPDHIRDIMHDRLTPELEAEITAFERL